MRVENLEGRRNIHFYGILGHCDDPFAEVQETLNTGDSLLTIFAELLNFSVQLCVFFQLVVSFERGMRRLQTPAPFHGKINMRFNILRFGKLRTSKQKSLQSSVFCRLLQLSHSVCAAVCAVVCASSVGAIESGVFDSTRAIRYVVFQFPISKMGRSPSVKSKSGCGFGLPVIATER